MQADSAFDLVCGAEISTAAAEAARDAMGDVPIVREVDDLPPADVAIACVGWRFDRIAPTLRQMMKRKTAVVSDCAEMAWPWLRHPHLADVIAGEARKAGVPLIGLGANAAVALAVASTIRNSASDALARLRIVRHIDLSSARPSVLRQTGIRRTTKQFRNLASERLVGLPSQAELVVLIAQALGRHPMRADVGTTMRPVTGEDGLVNGLQERSAWSDDTLDIEVDETATFGPPAQSDVIEVTSRDGKMVETALPAGNAESTAAALLATARQARQATAGLLTAIDILSISIPKE